MPARWIAGYGCLSLAMAVTAALPLDMWTADQVTSEADESHAIEPASFAERWLALGRDAIQIHAVIADTGATQKAAESLLLREPEIEPEPAAEVTGSLPRSGSPQEVGQIAPKGHVLYYNSPTHWTPVPLPAAIAEERAPHNRNIRAEIEQAAMLFGVDIRMMKAFARIESGYRPRATTGKYKCLFQLSDWEFARYWHGDIYDIRDCSIAAARKLATEAAQFEKDVGRRATATEIYCIHQQGYQGCAFHYAAPHQLAWKNMHLTAEGQQRGEAWARKAIWGNVPSDIKGQIKGGVDALTSAQFLAIWTERVERFMARKSEPPTDYVEYSSRASLPKKTAAKATVKGSVKASNKDNALRTAKKKTRIKVASR